MVLRNFDPDVFEQSSAASFHAYYGSSVAQVNIPTGEIESG